MKQSSCERCRLAAADRHAEVPNYYRSTYRAVCAPCARALVKTAAMFSREFAPYHFGGHKSEGGA